MFNRDVALYALGVGACAGDALDEKELKYVYHRDGQRFIQVKYKAFCGKKSLFNLKLISSRCDLVFSRGIDFFLWQNLLPFRRHNSVDSFDSTCMIGYLKAKFEP